MDWNKTKTIFIIVFSILNIFLYSLFLNRQMGMENVQVIGKTSIEETLKMDNITYNPIPLAKKEVSYLSANIAYFSEERLKGLKDQSFVIIEKSRLLSQMKTSVSVKNSKDDYAFDDFLDQYVLEGNEYELWEVDEEEQKAVFFQRVKDETIFYSTNAMLVIYWNADEIITHYEQRMLEEFVSFNHKKDLLSQDDAVASLATRGYLKPDSTVTHVRSGYSTLVQLTETQVFAPTWNVQVKLKNGDIENYFINAIEGKIIEFEKEPLEESIE